MDENELNRLHHSLYESDPEEVIEAVGKLHSLYESDSLGLALNEEDIEAMAKYSSEVVNRLPIARQVDILTSSLFACLLESNPIDKDAPRPIVVSNPETINRMYLIALYFIEILDNPMSVAAETLVALYCSVLTARGTIVKGYVDERFIDGFDD